MGHLWAASGACCKEHGERYKSVRSAQNARYREKNPDSNRASWQRWVRVRDELDARPNVKHGDPWTKSEVDLARSDLPVRELALRLNRTTSAVYEKRRNGTC